MTSELTRRVVRLQMPPSPASLQFSEEKLPQLSPDDVLVRVRASSLNYHDYLVLIGAIAVADGRIPLSDGAGTVVATGPNVKRFVPGDSVLGTFFPDWCDGRPVPEALSRITGDSVDGFAADYVVMPERCLTRMPRGLSFSEAATLPCAGVTAWTAITGDGGLNPGSVVLVQGTGGVSIWALQLAKAMGAKVVALTSSNEKSKTLRSLGADLILDYTADKDWVPSVMDFTRGQGVDLVIEVVGGANLARSISACRMGGRIAAIGFLADTSAQLDIPDLLLRHISISGRAVGSHADQNDLVSYVEEKGIKPFIGGEFDIGSISKAFDAFLSSDVFGKIIVMNDFE
jgi:NADPH:quinone reductase-like Zn-dependent oxidoreductase